MKGCDAVIGCDLHSYVEYRDKTAGLWKMVRMYVPYRWEPERLGLVEPFNGRNYELFAILAGVRGFAQPIAEPRGIPQDASNGVLCEYEAAEGWTHTPSWLTLAELRVASKDKKTYNKDERSYLKGFINGIEFMLGASWHWVDDIDVRVVFWFDN